jgi:hypothetical protein
MCYRFACTQVLGRMWCQTYCMHLNAAGTPVSKHLTVHRDTSTMLRHMSVATHVVEKWKEVFLATDMVSSNFSIMNSYHNFYLIHTTLLHAWLLP